MALRLVVSYLALSISAVFQIKKFAFCSSDSFNLYINHAETNLVIKESFTYSSLWIYSQEASFQLRPSRSSIMQLILLLCGDIETCPGPAIKCSTCLKTIRKNQSKINCLECNSDHHLKCWNHESEVLCQPCMLKNGIEAEQFRPDRDDCYMLPELRDLLAKKA